jgi:hypothetical protein
MKTDPDETKNLADKHPEIVKELTALAAEYVERGRSTPGPRQSSVGYPWAQLDWVPQVKR